MASVCCRKAMDLRMEQRVMRMIQEAMIKLKSFFVECVRVVRVTKKPNKENFKMIVKVSAMGMGLIGAVGFVISMIATLAGLV